MEQKHLYSGQSFQNMRIVLIQFFPGIQQLSDQTFLVDQGDHQLSIDANCEFRRRLSGHLRKYSWGRDDPLLDPNGRGFHGLVQPEVGGALIEVRVIKAANRRYVHHVNLSRVSTWKTQND